MPFFNNAKHVDINGGQFHDIAGNVNNYDYSRHEHNTNSHNTTNTTTMDSYNDSSIHGINIVNVRGLRNAGEARLSAGREAALLRDIGRLNAIFGRGSPEITFGGHNQEQKGYQVPQQIENPSQTRPGNPFLPRENSDPFPLANSSGNKSNYPLSQYVTKSNPELQSRDASQPAQVPHVDPDAARGQPSTSTK